MEDLFQLLFFAALILFALLGNARKKKKGQQVQPPRRPPVRPSPVRRPPVERREPAGEATRAQSSGSAPPRQRSIAQELFELLQERVEVEPSPPPPPPVTEPVVVEDEAQSLETLEPAGGKSHERFHELYMSEKERSERYRPRADERRGEGTGVPYEEVEQRKARLELSRRRLQQAFIMKEILSPPKGMQ